MKNEYDVVIVGSGPGGIFAAYELVKQDSGMSVAVFETGPELSRRHCPIDGEKVRSCINCRTCSMMSGFGGAGAFSDGKYNITNDFGGTLHEHIGADEALELMEYVDRINCEHGGGATKRYSTRGSKYDKLCRQNGMKLLGASVRHLGTDVNYIVLENLYSKLSRTVDFFFETPVESIGTIQGDGTGPRFEVAYRGDGGEGTVRAHDVVVAVGRSGSSWMEKVCEDLAIPTMSNRVDLGVRVELPAVIFEDITDELYEGKIVYRTKTSEDKVRTFCMNPYGEVVNENANGIATVNGHSYEDPEFRTENTNFALLVSKRFTEPFNSSNAYGEYIAGLSNMLGGGVMVQRFGDLIRGRRSTPERIAKSP